MKSPAPTDLPLFPPDEADPTPWVHVVLDGRRYRAREVVAYGRRGLEIEGEYGNTWGPVRYLHRRADVAHGAGLGRFDDALGCIVFADGTPEGGEARC